MNEYIYDAKARDYKLVSQKMDGFVYTIGEFKWFFTSDKEALYHLRSLFGQTYKLDEKCKSCGTLIV